jgi:hypothetical protein
LIRKTNNPRKSDNGQADFWFFQGQAWNENAQGVDRAVPCSISAKELTYPKNRSAERPVHLRKFAEEAPSACQGVRAKLKVERPPKKIAGRRVIGTRAALLYSLGK